MAKAMWLCMVVVMLVASSTSSALKCYHCVDCDNNSQTPSTCPVGHDQCVKMSFGGKVSKSCTQQAVCNMKPIFKQSLDLLKSLKDSPIDMTAIIENMKNSFPPNTDPEVATMMQTTLEALLKSGDTDDEEPMTCCGSDYCNAATNKMMNFGLLWFLPLALYILCQL